MLILDGIYVTIYWTSDDCDGQADLKLHLSVGQVIFPYFDHCDTSRVIILGEDKTSYKKETLTTCICKSIQQAWYSELPPRILHVSVLPPKVSLGISLAILETVTWEPL